MLMSSVSGTAVAQERPDFFGQWILVSSATANAAIELTVEFSGSLTPNSGSRLQRFLTIHPPPQPREYLSVERRFRNQRKEIFDITVVSASVLSSFGTERNDLFAAFEDQTLIIQRPIRLDPAAEQILRREIWSLTPDSLLRLTTTDRPTSGETVTTEALYRRSQTELR